ncbi:MAG: DUF6055 domain-containing protein [Tepidisphaeraceae bacterium]
MFWAKEYGDKPAENPDKDKRFDPDKALAECERFYRFYVDTLKFSIKGQSLTDQYKLLIYVVGGPGGTANGGGEDNKVGILWTPAVRMTRPPYGALAHEIGHSFQYLLNADAKPAGRMPGPLYEMTSQYMLWQVYPEWQTFEKYHLDAFMKQTHLAFPHENNQYHSPYLLEYWSFKHGQEFVASLWRGIGKGEDPVQAYQRLTKIDQAAFNDEVFDAARRFVTWDLPRIEKTSAKYANQHTSELTAAGDGWHQIAERSCPQNYGYNAIKLTVPAANTPVTLDFKGEAGATGFRSINPDKAGWRYGYLAVKADGSRVYGPSASATAAVPTGRLHFTVPANTQYLWLVVTGAPTAHWPHKATKDHSADEQWPYRLRLAGTAPDPSVLKPAAPDRRSSAAARSEK